MRNLTLHLITVQTAHFHAELWMFMLFIWDHSRGFHINASLVPPYLASLRSLLKTSFVITTVRLTR
jgi:hypothetical protein